MAGSAIRGSGSKLARPLDDRSRARSAVDGQARRRHTTPWPRLHTVVARAQRDLASASQLGWADRRKGRYTHAPPDTYTTASPTRGNVACMSRLSILRALRHDGIGLRFAMLGQMAYVFAENHGGSGSAGTRSRAALLAAALGLRHRWRAHVRQRRPAGGDDFLPGRAFHVPAGGRDHSFDRPRACPGRRFRADRTRTLT